MNILNKLFDGTRATKFCDSPLSVGNTGPVEMFLSDAHTRALAAMRSAGRRISRTSQVAKVNYAYLVVEYLMEGRVTALDSDVSNVVYTELADPTSGGVQRGRYNGSEYAHDPATTHTTHMLVPFVFWALRPSSNMIETKALFSTLMEQWSTDGKTKKPDVYKFCDAFYYEWKEFENAAPEEGLFNAAEIKGAIRTGNLTVLPILATCGASLPEVTIETVSAAVSSTRRSTPPSEFSLNEDDAKLWAECREGKLRLTYNWGDRAKFVRPLSDLDNYVPNAKFFRLVRHIRAKLEKVSQRMDEGCYGVEAIRDDYVNIILNGKAGTGKSTLAGIISAIFNLPLRLVVADRTTEGDNNTGMTKVAEGGFKFVETPFLDGFKNGGLVLMEEFNLADPGILMSSIGQAIEKPFILLEDNYREVRRHPLMVLISTMNPEAEGATDPNGALSSRSPISPVLDDPAADEFLEILKRRGYPETNCISVYQCYTKLLVWLSSSLINEKSVANRVTLRHCLAALDLMETGVDLKGAVEDTLIGAIGIVNIDLARRAYNEVIEPMAV